MRVIAHGRNTKTLKTSSITEAYGFMVTHGEGRLPAEEFEWRKILAQVEKVKAAQRADLEYDVCKEWACAVTVRDASDEQSLIAWVWQDHIQIQGANDGGCNIEIQVY